MFNQQIHGSKRALRSVEDFTEFEQRTAYFNGDPVTAAKKRVNSLDRGSELVWDSCSRCWTFDPRQARFAGILDPDHATEQELMGEELFFARQSAASAIPPRITSIA